MKNSTENLISLPWAVPEIGDEELQEVINSFKSGWLTQGPKVQKFEEVMAEIVQVPHAIAVSNGTDALDLSLVICGVGASDEVIVPSLTYFATASAVSRIGAIPVFVDVEPLTCTLDPARIEEAITPKTKAIVFIDYGGNPADVQGLEAIAKKHGIRLFQDAAQSIGAIYNGKPMGANTEISTTSFHMAKIMTTVEGGMIFTHNDAFAREARMQRNQGESGKYLHAFLGANARMMEMQAAVGLSQSRKLPMMIAERKRVAEHYHHHFGGHKSIELSLCKRANSAHANFLYAIFIENRDAVVAVLKAQGIDTRVCFPMPVYEQEVYRSGRAQYRHYPSPVAEDMCRRVLNLPIFPQMTEEQIDRVAECVFNITSGNSVKLSA